MAGADQCVHCTHGGVGAAEWQEFRDAVRRHHGIVVPADAIQF
jgi:hypothetical protein